MASRQIKMPAKEDSEKPEEDVFTQRKRPELGRYLLQVDRQTKNSYPTAEAAHKAGLVIKTGHPVVQVSVYDTVENAHTTIGVQAVTS